MSDQTDLESLAKGYMDLWQEHLTTISKDEDMAEIMAKTMAMMNSGAATFANAMSDAANSQQNPDDNQDPEKSDGKSSDENAPKAGTQAAATSSGHSDADVDQLLKRVALLEERVAELEQNQRHSKVRKRK